MNVGGRNPDFVDLELERAEFTMQVYRQMQRGHKCQQRDDEGKELDVAIAARDQQNQQPAHSRNEGDQRKDDGTEAFHIQCVTPIQTM